MDFKVVRMAARKHAFGALEKGAQVLEGAWMAYEDVHDRRRAPESPHRGCHISLSSENRASQLDGGPGCPRIAEGRGSDRLRARRRPGPPCCREAVRERVRGSL